MSYYLMHRGWRDHYLFKDQPYSNGEAWEHLIATANFAPSKYRQANKIYDIPRGDLATSYRSLAEKWKWSTGKTIRFLKLLQSDEMITLKTEQNFLWISVVNYDAYQNPYKENETQTKQERNQNETKIDTNVKKDKELKEEERKKTRAETDSDFDRWWTEYPHKVGRGAALSSFKKARGRASFEELIDGVRRYISTKPPDINYCNPATWLNQERWKDEPAQRQDHEKSNRIYTNKPTTIDIIQQGIALARAQREQGIAGKT